MAFEPGASDTRRCAIRVSGTVQGVGFRPFVFGLATGLALGGHVGNDAEGVFIEVEGPAASVAELLARLRPDAPALAVVEGVAVGSVPVRGESDFRIAASDPRASASAATSIPPDTAVCRDCLREMRDPGDRRFGYPFIACTHCGPRYTIVTGLPYDRANTTMSDFPLCQACRAEYDDPGSRRYHAQPTACWDCGPQLSMPVAELVASLRAGMVAAIKGVGGYHLVCDARDAAAVHRLRQRKQRGDKPFAVMAADLAAARRLAWIDAPTVRLLESPARPIALVDSVDPSLQARVAPGNNFLGLMLPYAPLHHLLFDAGAPDVLVMTSGNLADEPICTTEQEATARLAGIADVFCHHDRRISVACDDSVVRMVAGQPQPVRRSRGYAPMPVTLPVDSRPAVAVGGEIKATAAVAQGRRVWLTQHIGDTENLETLEMLARSLDTLTALQQVQPEVIVSDAHPGYLSRQWAAARAADAGMEHLVVQHHHAHLASLLAEHRMRAGTAVLGVVFDGTGYGTDGAIWGGELLLGSYGGVQRVGHLLPIRLPGGDATIRLPARTALAHLAAAGQVVEGTASASALPGSEVRVLGQMLAAGSHCVPTTSVGRLFDAVASLLDVRHRIDYEAQAAIELEALATDVPLDAPFIRAAAGRWSPRVDTQSEVVTIDPGGWIAQAVADHRAGVPVAASARLFHASLAAAVAQAAVEMRRRYGVGAVALTGGVFANAVLTVDCQRELAAAGFTVLTHEIVPPNDGGLALGQIAVAAAGGARSASGQVV